VNTIFINKQINKENILILPKNSGFNKYNSIFNELKNKKIFLRAEDIPLFIKLKNNQRYIGITGEDLFQEYNLIDNSLKIIKKIEWIDENASLKRPTLCLLGDNSKINDSTIAINKKYKNLAENYLLKNNLFPKEKLYFYGGTELIFEEKIANFVIDIVYSGKSIEKSNLKIIDKIIESNLVMIGDKNETKL
jgi:ATP phosphoribosyltransferase